MNFGEPSSQLRIINVFLFVLFYLQSESAKWNRHIYFAHYLIKPIALNSSLNATMCNWPFY